MLIVTLNTAYFIGPSVSIVGFFQWCDSEVVEFESNIYLNGSAHETSDALV